MINVAYPTWALEAYASCDFFWLFQSFALIYVAQDALGKYSDILKKVKFIKLSINER